MEVTTMTWVVALAGLLVTAPLLAAQLVAIVSPRSDRTIKHIYGGNPDSTDPKAYFAFNQGLAWADAVFWLPLQIAGSIGMLMGERWGFLVALVASVPFWYTGITIFIWDRDLGIRQSTFTYWVIVWGMFPAFGVLEMTYCFDRLLA